MTKKNDVIEQLSMTDEEKTVKEQVDEIMDDMTSSTEMILRKPIMYNGSEITKISFDFNKLTGADALNIESELNSMGKQVITATSSAEYLVRVARQACEQAVGVDFFKLLSIVDFNIIITKARFFLLGFGG